MARPTAITDERILSAAREVFADRGYSATTAEIAEKAQCSEGTLFKRFESKRGLFVAAMGLEQDFSWVDDLDADAETLEAQLLVLASRLWTMFSNALPVVLAAAASGLGPHQMWPDKRQAPPSKAAAAVTGYLLRARDSGALRIDDVDAAAAALVGGLHFRAFCRVTGMADDPNFDVDAHVRGVVDVVINGITSPTTNPETV